jgi:hypothetical protein
MKPLALALTLTLLAASPAWCQGSDHDGAAQLLPFSEAARGTRGATANTSAPLLSYRRAMEIAHRRDVAQYDAAIRSLEQIPQDHPDHAEAQAKARWLQADLEVRQAQDDFNKGRVLQAFEGLRRVLDDALLEPEAKQGLRSMWRRWAELTQRCRKGLDARRRGEPAEARRHFMAMRPTSGKPKSAALDALARAHLGQMKTGARIPPQALALGRHLLAMDPEKLTPPPLSPPERDLAAQALARQTEREAELQRQRDREYAELWDELGLEEDGWHYLPLPNRN